MSLHRLIYTSHRAEECQDDDIRDILKSCERKNPNKNISGILVHSKMTFFQYLEGEKEDIEALYNKIKDDKRHFGCIIKNLEPITNKIFPNWSMGFKDLDSQLIEFNTNINGPDLITLENIIYGTENLNDSGVSLLQKQLKEEKFVNR